MKLKKIYIIIPILILLLLFILIPYFYSNNFQSDKKSITTFLKSGCKLRKIKNIIDKDWQKENCPEWINCMPPAGCSKPQCECEGYTKVAW
jgi:hypothetical protein